MAPHPSGPPARQNTAKGPDPGACSALAPSPSWTLKAPAGVLPSSPRPMSPHLRALSVAPGSWRGRRFPLPANCFPGHSGQRRRGPVATWGGGREGRQGGGSCTGPRGRALPSARPGFRAAADQREARKREEGKSGLGKGRGRKSRNERLSDRQVWKGRRAARTKTPPPIRPRPVTPAQPHMESCRHGDASYAGEAELKDSRENWCPRRTSACLLLRSSCGPRNLAFRRGISDLSQLILWHAKVSVSCITMRRKNPFQSPAPSYHGRIKGILEILPDGYPLADRTGL